MTWIDWLTFPLQFAVQSVLEATCWLRWRHRYKLVRWFGEVHGKQEQIAEYERCELCGRATPMRYLPRFETDL